MSSQISPDCVGLALVDDDAMALAHLESYFSDVEDFTILTATRSPRAVLRYVQSHQVDVLITDVHMEHMDGVEMTREVLRLSPSTRVILLTTVDTDEDHAKIHTESKELATAFDESGRYEEAQEMRQIWEIVISVMEQLEIIIGSEEISDG